MGICMAAEHVSGEVSQRTHPRIYQYSYVNLLAIKKAVLAFAHKITWANPTWYKLLDMWCGNKPYVSFFTWASEYVWSDIIPWPMVDVICDNDAIPFTDWYFDVCLCNQTLEHTKNVHGAIAEMKRVVKKDGLLLVSIPFLYPEHACPWDFYRFTRFGLQEIFSGFEITSITSSSWYASSLAFYCNMLFTHGALMRKIASPLFLVLNVLWVTIDRFFTKMLYVYCGWRHIPLIRTIIENHYMQFTLDYIIVLKNAKK